MLSFYFCLILFMFAFYNTTLPGQLLAKHLLENVNGILWEAVFNVILLQYKSALCNLSEHGQEENAIFRRRILSHD